MIKNLEKELKKLNVKRSKLSKFLAKLTNCDYYKNKSKQWVSMQKS